MSETLADYRVNESSAAEPSDVSDTQRELDALVDALGTQGINTDSMLTQIGAQVKINALLALLTEAGILDAAAMQARYEVELLAVLRSFLAQVEQARLVAQRTPVVQPAPMRLYVPQGAHNNKRRGH